LTEPKNVHVRIPTIGTVLTLKRGWAFTLYKESRNDDFACRIGAATKGEERWSRTWHGDQVQVSLPAGTVLKVNRIYIRQNKSDYDSITLTLKKGDCPEKHVWGRFWVKLGDMNRIICEWDMETVRTDTKVDIITQLGEIAR